MSIAELEGAYDAPSDGPSDERVPPQDVSAEQSVLGGMLLSKDAIADCVEAVRGTDFYRPAHEVIWDAILDLYGRGEPADAITVADELNKRGELGRAGGPAYLHQLIQGVPTAANAGYYAQIVAERAVLRRLVDAGTRIVQMGYAQGGGDVEDLVNAAQAEVYAVADKRGGEDYVRLGEVIESTADEIEAASSTSGEMIGVPTGFTDLDTLTNGLHPGQMIVLAARPAVGKALALDTPLPTPTGWTTMGEVAVGDELIGADGLPTRVVAATEVMHERPCFEVEFSDGTVIVADEQHQWSVRLDGAEPQIVTTGVLAGHPGVVEVRRAAFGAVQVWKVEAVRPVASVPVRCVEVDNASHLYLASRAMIPTHNSTLGLDVVRSAAIKHNQAAVIFSLEMSKSEITMRLLSAEAEIQLQHMRKGQMRDTDWTRLAATMGRVSDAPLFIDDSPNMSLMEIRAKCRRLKQTNNLKLVVIDYLQLMTSGKRVESRQQEVSEFSRALKLLAKEIDVPVIAISQLNRGPEQRTDKRPQMSDLRESGCLTADTRLLRADTGAEVTIGELAKSGARDVPVWALDDSLRYVARPLTHAFSTGTRPVFRMTLASGKTVRATENHRFLTYDGWKQLGDLHAGDRIAVPRHVPAPEQHEAFGDDAWVRTMALLWSSKTPYDPTDADLVTRGCNLGVDMVPEAERELIPDLFHMPKRQIGVFVDALWRLDGRVAWLDGEGFVSLRAQSRRLLDGVSQLLLRFGISTRITRGRNGFQLHLEGVDDQRRFLQEVYRHGESTHQSEALLAHVREQTAARDAASVSTSLHDGLATAVLERQGQEGSLGAVATLLDESALDLDAVNDVHWDPIGSIELDGLEEVYDATVLGSHNFIANGIAAHNSIEQDADMVILLHREDSFNKESERAGEADLIVAKHRNGPTDTIVVAFQGHYSRFTNMAQSF
ncbi:replicative DNA helicase [Barrientosiimonas endolithica]|uniref:Replicative DNA helicase n=1 Tax=Barrientosiimonas endolithica TaxID=1535208 RepID=A0ABM8HFS8_9MICO|nr:replicative DNA helicase [Barrientosiimonas endolithica]BDZ59880.1 replicative DNA helicase [Barrientosiimonas endolithica]